MTELPEDFSHEPEDVATHYTGKKEPGDPRDTAHVWLKTGGGGEPIQLILKCYVPSERIIYSSMSVMNVSPHVRENEIMVHQIADIGPNKEFGADKGIQCVVISKSMQRKTTNISGPKGKYIKATQDIENV
jgi:hypothetical protein